MICTTSLLESSLDHGNPKTMLFSAADLTCRYLWNRRGCKTILSQQCVDLPYAAEPNSFRPRLSVGSAGAALYR